MSNRICDFCSLKKAVLYCLPDTAKLCITCDRDVHSTNPLFHKHNRSLLCDSCDSNPSSIFCSTESLSLCQNCDWDRHRDFPLHDRRPVEGFNGCPGLTDLLGFLGLDYFENKKNDDYDQGLFMNDDADDVLFWDNNNGNSNDVVVVGSNDCGCIETGGGGGGHSFQAIGVPPLPKNRNASCGKHKEEILAQLREMAKTEPNFTGTLEELEPDIRFKSAGKSQLRDISPGLENNAEPTSVPSYETSSFKWYDFTGGGSDDGYASTFVDSCFIDMNHIVPDKDSDDVGESTGVGNGFQEVHSCVPVEDSKNIQLLPPNPAPRELNSQERDSALSRYKEKKKTRRYDKHIRYESRKVRAESRTRIRGRFAKMDR